MIVRITPLVFVSLAVLACSGSTTGTGGDLFRDGGTSSGSGSSGGSKSPFGDATQTGGGTQNNAGGATTPSGAANATCVLPNDPLGTSACDQCVGGSCCSEAKACDGNSECVALVTCANECGGDDACAQDCAAEHQAGLGLLKTLYSCMEQSCAASCQ